MQVWLLSHLSDSPGNCLFLAEARQRGVETVAVKPSTLSWAASRHKLGFVGRQVPRLVFTRLGSSATEADLMAVRVAEASGIPVLNSYQSLRLCRDKAKAYLALMQLGVPIPDTLWLSPGWSPELVEYHCGPPPHIVKLSHGTQGRGVMLCESWRSLTSVLEAMAAVGGTVLVQRFLAESKGRDTRVLVLGGKVQGAAARQAQDREEFRSNLHAGGAASVVEPTPEQIRIAEAAVAALGLEVAGVDLLETAAGPVVVEVNGSPGYGASPFFVKHVWDYLQARYLGGEAFSQPEPRPHGRGGQAFRDHTRLQ